MDDKILERGALGGFRGSVGHKAGGFIAKKKFHPGSMANQEKLWLAREEIRKQREAEDERKRRHEEEVAEEARLEEQFNLTGKTDRKRPLEDLPIDQRRTIEETKRRLDKLKVSRLNDTSSRHTEVWGSWFDRNQQLWGYRCCRKTDRADVWCSKSPSCHMFCSLRRLH